MNSCNEPAEGLEGLTSVSPEVSVIVPAYNLAAYLPFTLDSALAQEGARFEIIVVNDGSTDETPHLLDACAARESRVRVIHQENRGLSAARNRGLREAGGDYVAFLDADDIFYPDWLATGVAALTSHPEWDAVICHAELIDQEGRFVLPRRRREALYARRRQLYEWFLQSPLEVLLLGNLFPAHAVMCRRSVVVEIGAFDESLGSLEDYDLWLRLLVAGRRFGVLDLRGVAYRRFRGTMSSNIERMDENWARVLDRRFREMPQGRLADPAASYHLALCAKDLKLAHACLAPYKLGDPRRYIERAEQHLMGDCKEPLASVLRDLASTAPGAEGILHRLRATRSDILAHRFHISLRAAKNKRTSSACMHLLVLCLQHPLAAAHAFVRLLARGAIVE